MTTLKLKHQMFSQIQMTIDMKDQGNVELENAFSFSMDYNEDNTGCVARLRHELKKKDAPEELFVAVECIGIYVCEGVADENDKKQAHVQAYNLLFPYAQGMIAHLLVSGGLPAFMIEMVPMNPDDVTIK